LSPHFWQRLLAAECSPSKSRVLLEELGSLAENESVERLRNHPLLSDTERRRLGGASSSALDAALANGVTVLEESQFPENLAQADGVPPALFIHGDQDSLSAPTIAIVGTRSASTYGKACARKFAEAFSAAGVTVVSGGALGIDAAAHRGALESGGRTVAVIAAGIDNVYPAVHRSLFESIRERGCVVSQFPVGSRPSEYRFLVRNHLVAALSLAVLVVEAPSKSGAIHTANAANELGREVFVVPANIDMLSFQGSFGLIRDGATLVRHPFEVLQSLGIAPHEEVVSEPSAGAVGDLILAVLTSNPIPIEKIVEQTGIEAGEILAELTMLELDGSIVHDAGGYAIRP
jgi:DNA processing protein